MSKNNVIRYALVAFLLLPLISFAQTQKMKEHKVIKGDTLWDISAKELRDPFLWPNIWKENTWIANPDLIYPGQIIKIPVYLIQQEKSVEDTAPRPEFVFPEPAVEDEESVQEGIKGDATPIQKYAFVDKSVVMAGGYIADTIPGSGNVGDSPSGQIIYGSEDVVYADIAHPVKAGDKFYVIKISKRIKHPITGKKIGYVISIAGIAEIMEIQNGETLAKITKSFEAIAKGDVLDPYYEIETPMTTGHFRSPDINGMIISTGKQMNFQSMLDIVYIDKGCKEGIEPGDKFRTLAVDDHVVPNGVIQVISCRDHTATAIILSSNMPISSGNIFAKLDKR
ncbi:MAG: LysM peptidoglycan-binding domain-containing protein [Smithella sp.]|jgi:hypothetical protein